MTREEAIAILKTPIHCADKGDEKEMRDALEMAINALSQEPMRDFTKEEAEAYSKALDRMYKPTGLNVFNEPRTDAVSREDKKHIDGFKYWCETNEENGTITIPKFVCNEIVKILDKFSLVTPRTNCQYRHENGNCLKVGGFCTSVDDKHCPSVTQKSGKWIDYSDEGYVECPFCGHATTCEDNIDELHYCFYCGARMVEPRKSEEIEIEWYDLDGYVGSIRK